MFISTGAIVLILVAIILMGSEGGKKTLHGLIGYIAICWVVWNVGYVILGAGILAAKSIGLYEIKVVGGIILFLTFLLFLGNSIKGDTSSNDSSEQEFQVSNDLVFVYQTFEQIGVGGNMHLLNSNGKQFLRMYGPGHDVYDACLHKNGFLIWKQSEDEKKSFKFKTVKDMMDWVRPYLLVDLRPKARMMG